MGLRGFQGLARKQAKWEIANAQTSARVAVESNGLSRVAKVIAFLEFLPITKGKLTGSKMKLLPSQRAFVEDLYGRRRRAAGSSRNLFRTARQRQDGLIAGLMLCHLLGPEAEMRGECYSAGIDRLQAGLIFNEMEAIIQAVPEFAARCNIQRFRK